MKNVAGHDVSRLMAGSMGVLGVLCEVSLKGLPLATAQTTIEFGMDAPPAPPLLRIRGNPEAAFDPACVFNPGRLVADL